MRAGLALLLCMLAPVASAQVGVAPYVKRDEYVDIRISPGGDYYAAVKPLEDRQALVVIRRRDHALMADFGGPKDSAIGGYWWINDERLVVALEKQSGSRDRPYLTGELHAINADGSQAKLLVSPDLQKGGETPEAALMVDPLATDDRNVLIKVRDYGANPKPRVERLDVYSGHRTQLMIASPVRNADFVADAQGRVRFAYGSESDVASRLYYRDDDAGAWRLLNDAAQSRHALTPLGFSADGKRAWLQETREHGPDAIVEWDTGTGFDARREVVRDAAVDPFDVILRAGSTEPVGAYFMHRGMQARFFDESSPTALAYRKLEKAFPGMAIAITSATRDGRLQVVKAWNDRDPGDFYLYDTQARHAELIFSQRAWFDPQAVAATREIEVKARDGLLLHGYLTTPAGIDAKGLPMVVLPHGGPYGIFDQWEFDDDTQLLAQAGYAVLRLNYRGSGNYGFAYQAAGAREWGGAMQDDLTDATRWAIAQGIADAKRICIYGASYGGYAALMGVAKEPDLYRCAVGYVGVYDLELMHRQKSRVANWMGNWEDDWVGERGDLAGVSPVNLAAQIKVPVLLVAGGEDKIAPIEHSRKMEKALRSAGVPVETLYVDSEDHGFYTEAHRREFYRRLLDFLSRNIGGEKAKAD